MFDQIAVVAQLHVRFWQSLTLRLDSDTIEDEVIPFAQGIVDLNLKQPLQPFSPLDREK
ncbi:hypothetical protein FOXB_15012 [Fusarium oxysporum f. sp. conglutinans Fo5176]|uniref:Uncharacterized protein n=1 Tax=Fusarium oxysporum (strain Fo5176) TaxID=660025 RepID=F9G8N0_FUSOF|nr:hypothetical protein FOXB_15012 [Fusarium oxysporum f. sp. conglutinans Fo5176]